MTTHVFTEKKKKKKNIYIYIYMGSHSEHLTEALLISKHNMYIYMYVCIYQATM